MTPVRFNYLRRRHHGAHCEDPRCQLRRGHAGTHFATFPGPPPYTDEWGDYVAVPEDSKRSEP